MTRKSSPGRSEPEGPRDLLHLQPTPAAVKAEPGTEAEIRLMLLNRSETKTSDAPVVDVGALPEGWSVVDRYDQQGTWRASTMEWFWWALAPEEKVRPTLTVAVPENAAAGTYHIDVRAHDANESDVITTVDVKLPPASGQGGPGDGQREWRSRQRR